MPIFRAGVDNQSPLLYQLTAPGEASEGGGGFLRVTQFTAQGSNDVGSASRPVIYNPSVAGTAASFGEHIECLDNPGGISRASFISLFATPPTTPVMAVGTTNLPMNVQWCTSPEQGWVLGPGASLVVFAQTRGGHAWSSSLVWEEL